MTLTLDPADTNNVDGQTIPLNTVFNYRLIGGIIPSNHSEELLNIVSLMIMIKQAINILVSIRSLQD